MGLKVETEKNQELARLIGRRLREACARDFDNELPTAIAGGLAALRDIEIRAADPTTERRAPNDASFDVVGSA